MRLVLLCGGSGQRLWPLSNGVRSKSFLKLLPTDQGRESMVQRVWKQLDSMGLTKNTYIATGHDQAEMLKNQIGNDVQLIIEPARRDTFPAIMLAASYLHDKCNMDPNETVCFMPVDLYVERYFFSHFQYLNTQLATSEASIALIGVKPDHPSSLYGYIVPKQAKQSGHSYYHVDRFIEKPRVEEAKRLITQHALWNCGIFACKLSFLLEVMKERLGESYEQLVENYGNFPTTSFDYEVLERAKSAVVIPYEGTWKDIGSWQTLTEELNGEVIGDGSISSDSVSTHIINELHIPVSVIGLSNTIVAVSADGILVADKNKSDKVKDWVKTSKRRPMYEERRWGWYRVLEQSPLADGEQMLTKHIGLKAGQNISYQWHEHRSEYWIIIQGNGEFVLDGQFVSVKTGDILTIPRGSKHAIKAISDMEMIEVQIGDVLVEEDIIRECLEWNKIEKS